MAELEDIDRRARRLHAGGARRRVLEGLGIPTEVHRAPLATLSGGFKLRVLLAQVLVGGPDVLLLDEPTNHLDILSIRWLEKFLADYAGCAVVISHDQRFLDNVSTPHRSTSTTRPSRSTPATTRRSMVEKAASARAQGGRDRAREDEIARKRAFVDRFGAKATKARQAQSRLKLIEKIEIEELPPSSRRSPTLRFVPERPSGREVLELSGISKSYGDKQVLANVSLTVRRGDRLGIIGPNGLGKSTLLKIAVERLAADAGRVELGPRDAPRLLPAGPPRAARPTARPRRSTILVERVPGREPDASCAASSGRVLFSGDDVRRRSARSRAARRRGWSSRCSSVEKPNVLVLDEPTNHLDLEAIEALVEALQGIRRDADLRLARPLVRLRARHADPRDHAGGPARLPRHLRGVPRALRRRPPRRRRRRAEGEERARRDGAPRRRRRERRRPPSRGRSRSAAATACAQLPKRRDKVLAAIEAAEARKKAIHDRYADPASMPRPATTRSTRSARSWRRWARSSTR